MRLPERHAVGHLILAVGCWLFVTCSVLPLFAQSETNDLPPLAPVHPQLQPTFWDQQGIARQHGTAVLVGASGVIAVTAFIFWLIFRPKRPVIVPPEVVAREILAKLLRQPENGKTLSEISQALRRYIGAAFGFPPGESTTAEFSAALADSRKIGPELAQAISGFLRECDERKFSAAGSPAPVGAAAKALELVERAERRRIV